MSFEKLSVVIANDYIDRFPEVVRYLRQAGMQIDAELETIGVVTGSIDSIKLADLEQVKGVAAVERQQEYHLPPPDNDLQ